jgi:methylated-DNA-[protein]-cysteine S-methyltransferase
MISLSKTVIPSPVGKLVAIASEKGLCVLAFQDGLDLKFPIKGNARPVFTDHFNKTLEETQLWLKHYFSKKFSKLKFPAFDLAGSSFAISAWKALCEIPVGKTESYGQLAKKIHSANAARAIGRVMNQNPIAIIIPCHRVIGSNGKLTGYAGGLHRKEWLLRHEGFHQN